MNEELIGALAQMSQQTNGSLHTDTLEFLKVKEHQTALAEAIVQGASRAQFLSIIGIDESIYANLRSALNKQDLDAGRKKIIAKRGAAGGLMIVNIEDVAQLPTDQVDREQQLESAVNETIATQRDLEKNYYERVKVWAIENGYRSCVVVGGQLPGYKWENPDLIAVEAEISNLSRQIRYTVVSFEVKLGVEPYAVWQAAHYQRFSNEVYLAFAKSEREIRDRHEGRIFEAAVELGLGVLGLENQKFKEIQTPKSVSPDPLRMEEIIANFSDRFKTILDDARKTHNECFKVGLID